MDSTHAFTSTEQSLLPRLSVPSYQAMSGKNGNKYLLVSPSCFGEYDRSIHTPEKRVESVSSVFSPEPTPMTVTADEARFLSSSSKRVALEP